MGLLSFFRSLGSSPKESSSPTGNGREEIDVTAEFNHKLDPIDRGERYEAPLDEALRQRGFGKTDGGGTMLSKEKEVLYIDVHMKLVSPEASIPFVTNFLNERGAPKGSKLRLREGGEWREVPFGVREGFAIHLDGVNLPHEVYQSCDSNLVVREVNQRLRGHGQIESYWQGPTETALYVYGDSVITMKSLIADFMASYPLCRGARLVDLAT